MRIALTIVAGLLLVAAANAEHVVTSGTPVLLRLVNSVNTKRAAPGDRIYLETAAPVFVNKRMLIPTGSYVHGTVIESNRPGRVKGRASLVIQFDLLTLRNGVAFDLKQRPSNVDTQGDLDRKEGKIEGDASKGTDALIIARTTAAGAGLGGLATRTISSSGKGIGIGSGIGAAAGIIGVLATRGKEIVLAPGTTIEIVLNRDLTFKDDDLIGQ